LVQLLCCQNHGELCVEGNATVHLSHSCVTVSAPTTWLQKVAVCR
jgi:hypothetical protein